MIHRSGRDPPTVLIVEDEPSLAELYQSWISERYTATTLYSGDQVLDMIDETVDAVTLDRRMPGLSGGEVVRELRGQGYDTPVAMVSAVPPKYDIIDLPIDDYYVKSLSSTEFRSAIESLVARGRVSKSHRAYLAAISKKAALLEAANSELELVDDERYQRLEDEIQERKTQVSDETAAVATVDLIPRFREADFLRNHRLTASIGHSD
jgi:two-component system response regulator AdeR